MQGFRGFRSRARFDFSSGFTVLSGRNGVGKSTVCDAIEYALSGQIGKYGDVRTRRETVDEYVWWRGEGNADDHYVELGLRRADGSACSIRRSRQLGSNKDQNAIATLLCNQAAVPDDPIAQVVRTSIIRDETIAAWSLDLPELDRFRLVRDAIGVVDGPDHAARADLVVKAVEQELKRAQEVERSARDAVNRGLAALSEARAQVAREGDIAAAIAYFARAFPDTQANSIADQIKRAQPLVERLRQGVENLTRATERARSVAPRLQELASGALASKLSEAAQRAEAAHETHAAAEARVSDAKRLLEAERQADQFAAHMALLVEHGTAVGLQSGHCPLCAAARSPADFDRAVAATRARLAERGARVVAAERTLQQAQRDVGACAVQVRESTGAMASLREQMGDLARLAKEIAAVYAAYDMVAQPHDVEAAAASLRAVQEHLVNAERALTQIHASTAVERVSLLETKAAEDRGAADRASERVASCERAIEQAKRIRRTAQVVAGEMVDERLATISPLLSELYRRLRPHTEWREIAYRMGGEVQRSLNLTVGDDLNPQFIFSSGQRRAAGLAFLLAVHLSRAWCRLRTLVLDDPVQHIDDYRALNLVEVLAALRREDRQILVAVEDPDLADLLCRRLSGSYDGSGLRYDVELVPSGGGSIVRKSEVRPAPRRVLQAAG
jgi:chromosome segregation protein